MSAEDTITLKEFIQINVSDLKTSIKDVHDTTQEVLEQATRTNARVMALEKNAEKNTETIESHNRFLVMDEERSKQKEFIWKLCMWGMPFLLAGLGYFGFLYVEHIKTEIIAQTSDQMITLLEKNYNIK